MGTIASSGAISLGGEAGTNRSIAAEFGGNDNADVKMSDYNRSHLPNKQNGTDWSQYSDVPLGHDNLKMSDYYGLRALYTALLTTGTTNFNSLLFTGHSGVFAFGCQTSMSTVNVTVESNRLKLVSYDIRRNYAPVITGTTTAQQYFSYLSSNLSYYGFNVTDFANTSKYTHQGGSVQNSTTTYINLSNIENVEKIELEWVVTKGQLDQSFIYAYGGGDVFSCYDNTGHDAHFQNRSSAELWGQSFTGTFSFDSGTPHTNGQFNKTVTYDRSFNMDSSPLTSGVTMSTSMGSCCMTRSGVYGWPSPCVPNATTAALKLLSGGSIKLNVKVTSGGHTTTHVMNRSYTNSLNPYMISSSG